MERGGADTEGAAEVDDTGDAVGEAGREFGGGRCRGGQEHHVAAFGERVRVVGDRFDADAEVLAQSGVEFAGAAADAGGAAEEGEPEPGVLDDEPDQIAAA